MKTEKTEIREAWMIYVPTTMDGKQIELVHHQVWDKVVSNISGGLTLHNTLTGKWQDQTETNIQVEIAIFPGQLEAILDFTLRHYKQKAIMAKKISDKVIIKYA